MGARSHKKPKETKRTPKRYFPVGLKKMMENEAPHERQIHYVFNIQIDLKYLQKNPHNNNNDR